MAASSSTACSSARHEFERRGSRIRSQCAVEDASCVPAVLGPVGAVDFVVDVVVGVDECDVLLKTADPYSTLVPVLGTSEPMTTSSPNGSGIYIVAVTDRPDGHWFSQRAIAPD